MMFSWRLLGNSRMKWHANIGAEPRIIKPLQLPKAKTSLASTKPDGLDSQSSHRWCGNATAEPTLYSNSGQHVSRSLASEGNTVDVQKLSEATSSCPRAKRSVLQPLIAVLCRDGSGICCTPGCRDHFVKHNRRHANYRHAPWSLQR